MARPLAVVFDMDGLMFDTEAVYWRVGSELLRRRGCEFTRQLNDAVMGRPPRACFEEMIRWHSLEETWHQLAAESEVLFFQMLDESLSPMPGLLELLDALEGASIPKAICTGSTRAVLTALVSRFDMEPRFRFTLSAEDVTQGKPDPEIYLKAAQRFGIEAGQMLVLEDSQAGCRSAAAAGAFVVAVPGTYSTEQDFSVASMVIAGLADPRLYEVLQIENSGS